MNARTHGMWLGLALGVLAGCSGGDGSTPAASSTPRLAGVWGGTVTDTLTQPTPKGGTMFADESGEFQLVFGPPFPGAHDPPLIVYGNACCQAQIETSATVSKLNRTGQANLNEHTQVRLSLSIQARRLTGSFEYEGRRLSFDLERFTAYPSRLTMTDLAGVYSGRYAVSDIPRGWTLTIQSTGAVTGSDEYGCNWLGAASIANTNQNMFQLELDAQGCVAAPGAPANGEYHGLGFFGTNAATEERYPGQDAIQFNLVGPLWFGGQALAR